MLPHKVTTHWTLFPVSFPSPAQCPLFVPQAPPGVLTLLHSHGCPTAPGKGNPRVPVPGMQWCKSWGRLPWTDFGCWGGKAQQPVGGGETGRQTAPTFRAQTQEVHLRQPLHSCRGQAVDPSSALDLGEAGSDRDPGWESPGMPADPTPGMLTGGVSSQESRSPWAGVARPHCGEMGTSQGSSPLLAHSSSPTFSLGARGIQG